ncbi:hypothetical protein GCM10020220_005980 [Nonomuraea rubra]
MPARHPEPHCSPSPSAAATSATRARFSMGDSPGAHARSASSAIGSRSRSAMGTARAGADGSIWYGRQTTSTGSPSQEASAFSSRRFPM